MVVPALAPSFAPARCHLCELPADARDAILGTTFQGHALRQWLDALFKGRSSLSTAALHAATVRQCGERNKLSTRLHAELDRRHRDAVRRFALADGSDALHALWAGAADDRDLAGPLWAALTHPAGDAAFAAQVLDDLRLAQYGALAALQALADENAVLTRELARVQQRSTRAQAAHAALQQQWQAEVQRQRAALAERDAAIATLTANRGATPAAVPGAEAEAALQRATARTALLEDRVRHLQQALQRALHAGRQGRGAVSDAARPAPAGDDVAAWARDGASAPVNASGSTSAVPSASLPASASASSCRPASAAPVSKPAGGANGEADLQTAPALNARSVLCVGGRPGQVPIYRDLVERCGGRFAHHDGGIADRPQQLDAVLAAADLVICQAGCISHNAYWLVKDHCKRTGKRCVYLQNPSITSFERGLAQLPAEVDR